MTRVKMASAAIFSKLWAASVRLMSQWRRRRDMTPS